jgi:hypothetical protein
MMEHLLYLVAPIVTGPGYRLPFETRVIKRINIVHIHRDRNNNTWKEPMQLSVRVPEMRLAAIRPANNDNEKAA